MTVLETQGGRAAAQVQASTDTGDSVRDLVHRLRKGIRDRRPPVPNDVKKNVKADVAALREAAHR